MRESWRRYTTLGLVAFALVLGWQVAARDTPAARIADAHREVHGPARVVDGDTIDINGLRIRLEGIDAPEAGQSCGRGSPGSWACGTAASAALARRVLGQEVTCEQRGTDKYGRMLGVCFAGGTDLNAWMVRQGLAWAFVKYSSSYVKEEAAAKAEGLGIWQGEAVPAWEYRHRSWDTAALGTPQGCAIKGNITRNGRIYHMPWSPWYARIRLDPEKGERWFCTEAEALAAGWRPVQAH